MDEDDKCQKIIIRANNNYYDVTDFLKIHPGGGQFLISRANNDIDCTKDYNYHSKNAKKLWSKYMIKKNVLNKNKICIIL